MVGSVVVVASWSPWPWCSTVDWPAPAAICASEGAEAAGAALAGVPPGASVASGAPVAVPVPLPAAVPVPAKAMSEQE
ncbi:hypothetical protein SFUMM280S_06409 [Streptomyces fumanus]